MHEVSNIYLYVCPRWGVRVRVCARSRVCVCGCSAVWTYACACVRVTLLVQRKKQLRHIIFLSATSLAQPYFSTYFINGTISGKSYWTKNMFWFSLQLLSKTFLILRIIQRYIVINVKTSLLKHSYFCQILMQLELSRQIFDSILNKKLYRNPSRGSRVAPCERTDGRMDGNEEGNSRFSQFC